MWGRRLAIAVWLAFAVVTWNVVFDRAVSVAAASVTRDNVERHQRAEPVPTLNLAYRPRVRDAAWHASVWAGGVLVAGAAVLGSAGRFRRQDVLP